MAVVLPADVVRRRHADRGQVARDDPGRGAVRAVRLAPGARVQRRGIPDADRRALVHQLDLDDPRACRACGVLGTVSGGAPAPAARDGPNSDAYLTGRRLAGSD